VVAPPTSNSPFEKRLFPPPARHERLHRRRSFLCRGLLVIMIDDAAKKNGAPHERGARGRQMSLRNDKSTH
jgi:hypothetical protein